MRRNWGVALEELPDVTEGIRTELIQRNQGDGALAFASLCNCWLEYYADKRGSEQHLANDEHSEETCPSGILCRSEPGYLKFLPQIQSVKSKKPTPDLSGAPRSPMPRDVEPMLCALVPRPFDRPNWIFEIKWDGYRAIAEIDKTSLRLYSRKLKSLEGYFPQLVETLAKLNVEAVLDGEVVALEVLDEEGRSHFELLRHRRRSEKDHLIYYLFDLLYLDGRDLLGFPLLRRKAILEDLIERTSPPGIQFSDHVGEHGKALFDEASKRGLEGIVGKDAGSPYVSGARTDYWVKFKNYRIEQFRIGGSQEISTTLSRCCLAFSRARSSSTLDRPTKA